jgi:amino acid adenylation domain-containing protein
VAVERLEGFRLSPQQRRLWRLMEANGSAPFRARCLLRLTGPAGPEAVASALARVVEHHAILRTVFERLPGMSLPVQVPQTPSGVRLAVEEGTGPDELWAMSADADTDAGLSARLSTLRPGEHLLRLGLPALCADARTLANLAAELGAAWEQGEAYSPETLPYTQFAEWHNGLLEDEDAAESRAFWEAQGLARVPPLALPFAADRPGPFEPRTVEQTLDPALARRVEEAARATGVPVETFCLAAWQTLLRRLTGRDELVSGYVSDGRGHELLERSLGLFARALPVRTALSPRLEFSEVVRRVQGWIEETADHAEHFRFGDALPWFAAGFAWEERPGGLAVRIERRAICCERFDLLLTVVHDGASFALELVHDAGRVRSEDTAYVGRLYGQLLASAAAAPETPVEELAILGPAERQELVLAWNRTAAEFPADRAIHRLFEEQAARTPGRPAVVFGNDELTYADLEARANRLARHLRALGVGPEVPVGLLLERSTDLIVALLGVLKAGGAYLPLDPTYPADRLAAILEEAQAPVVITTADLVPAPRQDGPRQVRLDADADAIDRWSAAGLPEDGALPDHLAYVLYTSGTTGRPKGVMVRHRSVANLAAALAAAVYRRHDPDGRGLRVSLNAPLTFDASVKQWIQLLAGHTLVLVPEEARPDAERLLEVVRRSAVDVLDCTPSQLRGLVASGFAGPGERGPAAVLVGGEAIDAATWERLVRLEEEGSTRFYNVYGPTECTVDVTVRPLEGPRPVLGLPLGNVRGHVLDERLRPAPLWVAGELFVGGEGVARGYLARPGLMAEKFVPDPFAGEFEEPGARLYRTGDVVRRLPEGEIEFLGRRDHQVKVRGFRIELEEIEAALAEHPEVRQAAATLRGSADDPHLAAYVVPRQGAGDEISTELKAWLRRKLPEFMVPGTVTVLSELPLTRSGKVDRNALPDPGTAAQTRPAYVAPQSDAERTVAAIWQDVLGVEAVGVDDNFFDLGGHSLLMVRAHGRLQEAFGRPISMVDLFRFTTVGSFAEYLTQGAAETVSLAAVRDRAGRQREEQERQRGAMARLRRVR